jgi:transposase
VEAFLSMDKESWINGHINAFRYFGGVPRILVSQAPLGYS